jgi:hypothetical protein
MRRGQRLDASGAAANELSAWRMSRPVLGNSFEGEL